MDPTQLQDLLVLLRAHGVTRYATPELTVELGPAPLAQSEPAPASSMPEDADDLAFWSSGGDR